MMLTWKAELKAVGDNPNYIEEQIKAIQLELKLNRPNTSYLASKVNNINVWLVEIDLAKDRARIRAVRAKG